MAAFADTKIEKTLMNPMLTGVEEDAVDVENPPVLDEMTAVAADPSVEDIAVKDHITKEKPMKPLELDASAEGGERVDETMHCVDKVLCCIPGTRGAKIGLVTLISISVVFLILWFVKDVIECLFEHGEGSTGRRLMQNTIDCFGNNEVAAAPLSEPEVQKKIAETKEKIKKLEAQSYEEAMEKEAKKKRDLKAANKKTANKFDAQSPDSKKEIEKEIEDQKAILRDLNEQFMEGKQACFYGECPKGETCVKDPADLGGFCKETCKNEQCFDQQRNGDSTSSASIKAVKCNDKNMCESEADCSICLNPLLEKKTVALPCDHQFHSECIAKWLKDSSKCPNCRHELKNEPQIQQAQKKAMELAARLAKPNDTPEQLADLEVRSFALALERPDKSVLDIAAMENDPDHEEQWKLPLQQENVLVAGMNHTCALRAADRAAVCWGDNAHKQCDAPPPTDEEPFVALAAGEEHSCALRSSGSVACWGSQDGERASPPKDLPPVIDLAVGAKHTCTVTRASKVVCWGQNDFHQCEVPSDLGAVRAVAAGWYHTCAILRDNNRTRCWGNYEGTEESGPVSAVAAGWKHTCAIRKDGSVACWGAKRQGHKRGHDPTEVPASLTGRGFGDSEVRAVSAGKHHNCAVFVEGRVECWGKKDDMSTVPRQAMFEDFVAVAAGTSHTCALQASGTPGTVVCWGSNTQGQSTVPEDFLAKTAEAA